MRLRHIIFIAAALLFQSFIALQANAESTSSVTIPDEMKVCSSDLDCIEIETTCNGCCKPRDAMNKAYASRYLELKNRGCSEYRKRPFPNCDCYSPPAIPKCASKSCTLTSPTK